MSVLSLPVGVRSSVGYVGRVWPVSLLPGRCLLGFPTSCIGPRHSLLWIWGLLLLCFSECLGLVVCVLTKKWRAVRVRIRWSKKGGWNIPFKKPTVFKVVGVVVFWVNVWEGVHGFLPSFGLISGPGAAYVGNEF